MDKSQVRSRRSKKTAGRGFLRRQLQAGRQRGSSRTKRTSAVVHPSRGMSSKAAAIVTVMNEEGSITAVLRELAKLPLQEIIVVMNGCTDRSFELARACSNAVIVHYPEQFGHDIGRAVGAKLAQSEILLFVDGDIPLPADELLPFINAIRRGWDVALNNLTPFLGQFAGYDEVTTMKTFVNEALNRPDLKANSLTAVPHALSRRAVERVGIHSLMVPPKAQALALSSGLKVTAPASVNVITTNRSRAHNEGSRNPVAAMIIGDHLEALQAVMYVHGSRLTYHDPLRKRNRLGGG